jgi:hypothetical protein
MTSAGRFVAWGDDIRVGFQIREVSGPDFTPIEVGDVMAPDESRDFSRRIRPLLPRPA